MSEITNQRFGEEITQPVGWLAWAAVIMPLIFVALDFLASALNPGYNLTLHTVSDLAVGPLGWLQTLNFILAGAYTILLGISLSTKVRPLGALFVLWGVNFVMIALLPIDPGRRYILYHNLHYVALDGVLLLFPVICLVTALSFWKQLRGFSLLSLVLFLLAVVVAASWLISAKEILALPMAGLYERMVIWIAVAWCMVLSWKIVGANPHVRPANE